MKINQLVENKLKTTVSLLAGAVALFVVLIVPSSYFYIQYQNLSAAVQRSADIAADDISAYAFKNPDTWNYQETPLTGFLEKYININKEQALVIGQEYAVNLSIGKMEGKALRLVRYADVSDGINIVAQVQVQASMYPIISSTLFTFILSFLLGLMIYAILYYWPLRELNRTLQQLNKTHHKLEIKVLEKQVMLKEADQLSQKLHDMAMYDALTKLPNRVLFNDRLSHAIEKAKRRNEEFAILFIDLDRFKPINDSLGHDTGDKVLQVIAQRLNNLVRKEDTVARLGGDEFTILMEALSKTQSVLTLSQKILKSLTEPIIIDAHTLYVSSSIGISLYPKDNTEAHNLLKFADAAMYRAKKEGRNNFQFYTSEMTEQAFEHIVMEVNLRQAIEKEEFIVYYQPQINAVDSTLIGMEALVRWHQPGIGLVSPAKFIPLAEETGLIIDIDQWVMKTAMKQIVQWHKKGLKPGVLALNLAMKQLQQEDFIALLRRMFQATEFKPQWLELEVTEGQIMTNPENAITVLKQISDMGIELAVDDFGTGYSSLSYLKRLPIDKLKIDQSFVRALPDDDEDAGISKAVIALSKSLNLKIIAEGVETEVQKDFLVKNGCPNIQGYFYGKPMPADEMEVYLKTL